MEEILNGIYMAVGAFLLCVALSLTFLNDRKINKTMDMQREIILDKSIICQEYSNEENKNVAYKELMTSLMNGIECPIRIDNVSLTPETFEPKTFDFSLIPQTEYKKTYYYTKDNKIELIQYEGVR